MSVYVLAQVDHAELMIGITLTSLLIIYQLTLLYLGQYRMQVSAVSKYSNGPAPYNLNIENEEDDITEHKREDNKNNLIKDTSEVVLPFSKINRKRKIYNLIRRDRRKKMKYINSNRREAKHIVKHGRDSF